MSDLQIQHGESFEADFDNRTWTFKMPEDFEVAAGFFTIIPAKQYKGTFTRDDLISFGVMCSSIHPDQSMNDVLNKWLLTRKK